MSEFLKEIQLDTRFELKNNLTSNTLFNAWNPSSILFAYLEHMTNIYNSSDEKSKYARFGGLILNKTNRGCADILSVLNANGRDLNNTVLVVNPNSEHCQYKFNLLQPYLTAEEIATRLTVVAHLICDPKYIAYIAANDILNFREYMYNLVKLLRVVKPGKELTLLDIDVTEDISKLIDSALPLKEEQINYFENVFLKLSDKDRGQIFKILKKITTPFLGVSELANTFCTTSNIDLADVNNGKLFIVINYDFFKETINEQKNLSLKNDDVYFADVTTIINTLLKFEFQAKAIERKNARLKFFDFGDIAKLISEEDIAYLAKSKELNVCNYSYTLSDRNIRDILGEKAEAYFDCFNNRYWFAVNEQKTNEMASKTIYDNTQHTFSSELFKSLGPKIAVFLSKSDNNVKILHIPFGYK